MRLEMKGNIDSRVAEDFINQIKAQYSPGEDVQILIDSTGGFINSAIYIAEMIRFLQSQHSKVTILNIGDVMSAATIIWLVCEVRIWDPHYDFLIHNPYMQNVTGDANQLIQQAIELTEVEEDIVELYCTISDKTEDDILTLMAEERPMTTEELQEFNFVTQVVI